MEKTDKLTLIRWRQFSEYVLAIFNSLKGPTTFIVVVYIISSKFYNLLLKSHMQDDPRLVLDYISVLIWPTVMLFVVFIITPFLPQLVRRVIKVGAGNYAVDFAQTSAQEVSNEQVTELRENEESREPASSSTDEADIHSLLTSAEARLAYEQIYKKIFGTQLNVLKRLVQNIPEGLTKADLSDLYDDHRQIAPNPYPTFNAFMQWLIDNSLVLYNAKGKNYQLTNAGNYFLLHLTETGDYERFRAL